MDRATNGNDAETFLVLIHCVTISRAANKSAVKARITNAYLLINNEAITSKMRNKPIAVARGRFLPV
jgi:hypothetical protein